MHFDAHTWMEEPENYPSNLKTMECSGRDGKAQDLFPREKREGRGSQGDLSKGEFMFEVCENKLEEVETKKETENSTCTRHIVLAVETENGMVIIEAEAVGNVELVGVVSVWPRQSLSTWVVTRLCECA